MVSRDLIQMTVDQGLRDRFEKSQSFKKISSKVSIVLPAKSRMEEY